jgi:hypothetical protein
MAALAPAIAYGVACQELEACDSGRAAASVQGSVHTPSGGTGRKIEEQWLPGWPAEKRSVVRPHRARSGWTRRHADLRPERRLRLGAIGARWITNGACRHRRGLGEDREGIRGFLIPRLRLQRQGHPQASCAPPSPPNSPDEVRLPAKRQPRRHRAQGTAAVLTRPGSASPGNTGARARLKAP